jgi:hypothetical protein
MAASGLSKRPAAAAGSSRWLLSGVVGLVLIVGIVVLLNLRQPVSLTDDQYRATIALYRVCNQRDAEGLAAIEQRLRAADDGGVAADEATAVIEAVIQLAREGEWDRATEDCRILMEDQVQR